ncbi:branched-chain amino acid ABC transporter ATP-binding protein/permease [Rhizobium ruizarguesonis]|uniref:ATP-binding cassette domain-containing protein n=1 Tax=Rhizobium ruizarguesonis TaxID=2081791 RepID=A0AAE5C1T2_9HYPH|nr:ATP-binding cassette domain-containing protein [Rhizobium ruizarguesonis]MBY5805639.1 ATP-binding cassette domain-containing protein [Rhizobium leguminosarum]QND23242.1 ATP-binding cassette domain-containing protein [Rhizobium leguminosarum bv. viciae]MBY5842049.1 ATP-binding cassette domain-containing protein [Rhizobium leguminosarum]MBY5888834.1 ATP-binding cassette domain-containing protein [Rhizobium leguminosarum]MBY5893801.1 ATP-binding cassette domain-containing protein [Rhizobium le
MPDRQKLRLVLLLALALTALLLIVFGPMFLGRFSLNVLTRSMIYAMLAITVDLLWGYTGVLTFGQAAFFGVGAYATAMVLTHIGASPALFVVALAAAVLVPLALGLAVGWLSFYHGSTALYATVISLVVPIVITQLIFSGGTWTGSSSGLVGYETLPLGLPGYFRLSGACLLVLAVLAIVFVRSDAGRLLVAIRDNEARIAYLGMNPARLKIVLTGVLAGVCGLAGFLYANASGVVAPENTGFVFGTELVVWTALGGRGTIIGPLFGAIGIDYLSASLSGDLPFLWQLIIGALFVAMIILLPGGLASLLTRSLQSANSSSTLKSLPTRIVAKDGALAGKSLLSIRGLGKSYGSFSVLKGIDLEIGAGELVSLVGPNGAGKTTLMRCLSDGTQQIEGQVDIIGTNIAGRAPERIVALGVGRKFQVASIFDSMTIGECLKMARFSRERPDPMRSLAEIMLPAAAAEILTLTGMADMLDKPVSLLSHGQRQALELAMVVALEPRIILLDEPTAGLTKTERMTIGTILKKLTDEMGFAAILVEHDLDFVRDISSRIVVLHQGKLVLDGTVNDVVNSETVRTIYAGGAHG